MKSLIFITSILLFSASSFAQRSGDTFLQTGSKYCDLDCTVAASEAKVEATMRAHSICYPLLVAHRVSEWSVLVAGYGRLTATALFSCENPDETLDAQKTMTIDAKNTAVSPCQNMDANGGIYQSLAFNWATQLFDVVDSNGQLQSYNLISDLLKEHCVVQVIGEFQPLSGGVVEMLEFPDLEELNYFDVNLSGGAKFIRFPKLMKVNALRISDASYPNIDTIGVELPNLEEGRLLFGGSLGTLKEAVLSKSYFERNFSGDVKAWLTMNCSVKSESANTVELVCRLKLEDNEE